MNPEPMRLAAETPRQPHPVARTRRPPAPPGDTAVVARLVVAGPTGQPTPPSIQGALTLDLSPAPSGPHLPELALVPDEEALAPEVRIWAARFAQAVVEVTGGDRPVTQLLRWTAPRVYHDLDRRVRVLAQTRTAGQRQRSLRPQVRSVRVCLPGPDCAEVSVHVRYGPRSRALAARLELRRGRWTCTALQLG